MNVLGWILWFVWREISGIVCVVFRFRGRLVMYDELIGSAENRAYLNAVKREAMGPNLEILQEMPRYEDLGELEDNLRKSGKLRFDPIFEEPTGFYLLKCFLIADYSVDKAVFVKDVELFRKMRDPSARLKIGRLIYERFVGEDTGKFPKGESVFERRKKKKFSRVRGIEMEEMDPLGLFNDPRKDRDKDDKKHANGNEDEEEDLGVELRIGKTNAIGVYGPSVVEVGEKLSKGDAPRNLFDEVAHEVLTDLRMDVFPRFEKSTFFQKYIRTKSLERLRISHKDFSTLKMLGRGAFGAVNAAIKRNTGKLYAIKCINKRRVMATDSVDNIMSERNILAVMDSDFVCGLKYAVQDADMLYLVMDIMTGGDLKFHLNREDKFSEIRSRFYAAEILLGLEHIHSKGVIYRDV